MKFEANRHRLLEAFSLVGTVVPQRSVKPILKNVRLTVGPDQATLVATDLEVTARCHLDLEKVEVEGDILLPAARVQNLLREATADSLTIEVEDSTAEIRCGNALFKVQTERTDEFPKVRAFDEDHSFTIGREIFRTLARKTSFATARERTRFAFNGVRFNVEDGVARMVATDGKRLAVKWAPVSCEGDHPGRIIPTKGLQAFDRILRDEDETIEICLQEKQAMIRSSRAEISTRLVEGAFPDHRSVLPAATPFSAEFGKEELLQSLRQASVLTNEESRSVRFSFEEDQLILTSRAIDVGESRILIETQYEGDPIQVSFNPDYLIDGLKVIDADTVTLKLSGTDTPALLEGEENFTYLVMPVTLRTG